MTAKIAILGGGLSGRLIALNLIRAGFQVGLYDKGSREGNESAAYVAAAMLAPMAEAVDATELVLNLGKQSILLWQEIIPSLNQSVFMQQKGSLIVWHPQDKSIADQFRMHIQNGHQGEKCWQECNTQEIVQLEPQLSNRFQQGFYLPSEGQLDNRQVLSALASTLESSGVDCYWNTEKQVEDIINHVDWLIDCRGICAKNAWNEMHQSTLRGVRGEVARVYAPEINLNRPVRLLHPRYPLYIAPKENHIFVIGATQIESEDESEVSVRSGLELMSALYAVHPAFGEARILELMSRLRPTLNHHNPEIRFHRNKKLVEVNGLFRHGFMISPAVAAATSRLLQQIYSQQEISNHDTISGMDYIIEGI